MKLKLDSRGQAEPFRIYLGTADCRLICALNGIQPESVSLTLNLNNTCELSFTADQYVTEFGETRPSNGYDWLDEMMRVYVDQIGWFILKSPETSHDGNSQTKQVTAESAEIELLQHDLVDFKINCGTTDSMEMLAEGNVDTDSYTGVEFARQQIRFCDFDNPDLSLLHLVLKSAGITGFTIGEIDSSPKKYTSYEDGELVERYVMLKDEIGYFDVSSQGAYAFLTQDIEKYFECIISFDIRNFTVNACRVESLGQDTNIQIGFRNLENTNSITVNDNSIYTRYRVRGADDLTIRYVNFGSDIIEDIDYKLNTRYLDDESLLEKYRLWKDYTEQQRPSYIRASRQYNQQLEVISELHDRVPLDDCSTDWYSFSLDALKEKKLDYTASKAGIESLFLHPDGTTDLDALMSSDLAGEYIQITEVILPNIDIAIFNKGTSEDSEKKEYIKVTDWNLYGLDELDAKLKSLESQKELLEGNGYGVPYTESSNHSKDNHEAQYEQYQKVLLELDPSSQGSPAEAYALRKEEVDSAGKLLEEYAKARQEIAASVEKSQWHMTDLNGVEYFFTDRDLYKLSKLYNDTDYVNNNMFLVSSDDQATAIDEQQKLLDAALHDLSSSSVPQYRYKTTLDNFLTMTEYRDFARYLEPGNFIRLNVTDDYQVNLRVTSISFNPFTFDNDLSIEFSNMVKSRSKRNDFASLVDSSGSSRKNQISGSSNSSGANENSMSIRWILDKILSSTALNSKISNTVQKEFGGYIGTLMVLKELESEMIKAVNIEAENGFFQYLQSALITTDKIISDSALFDTMATKLAAVDNLLAGNISAELGHIIRLTASNVSIDEAVIREIIAAHIFVSDLKAGDITLDNTMRIISSNGYMVMNGNTLQIKGTSPSGQEYTAIQLGYDAEDRPALIIRDERGAIMLDAEGLHESIVPDGFIRNDMISPGSISKDKLNFQFAETDEKGNISASRVVLNGEGIDVKFTTLISSLDTLSDGYKTLTDSMSGLSTKVNGVEQSITSEIWKSSLITVTDPGGTPVSKSMENLLVTNTADINGISTAVSKVQTENESLNQQVTQAVQDAQSFRQTVSSTYAKKTELEKSVSDWNQTAGQISSSVKNLEGSYSTLNQTVGGLTQTVSDVKGNVTSLSSSVKGITTRVENSEGDLSRLEQNVNSFKTTVSNTYATKTSLSTIEAKADSLELKVSQKQDLYPTAIRYIRDWLNGNSANSGNHFIKCKVMVKNVNIADSLTATALDQNGIQITQPDNIQLYTKGDLENDGTSYVQTASGKKCLQIDLGSVRQDIDTIQVWHYYSDKRIYNHKLEVSKNGTDWIALYDSNIQGGYNESASGKIYYISDSTILDNTASLEVELGQISAQVSNNTGAINKSVSDAEANSRELIKTINNIQSSLNESIDNLPDKNYVSTKIQESAGHITTQITNVEKGMNEKIATFRQDSDKWLANFATLGMEDSPDVTNTAIQMSKEGIIVTQSDGSRIVIDTTGLSGIYDKKTVFQLKQDLTVTDRVQVENGADFTTLKYINRTYTDATVGRQIPCLVHVVSGGSE